MPAALIVKTSIETDLDDGPFSRCGKMDRTSF